MSIVTLQDIRDEGVTEAMASDSKVLKFIAIAQDEFEAACGQWFEARAYQVTFDGRDVAAEFFYVPIIEVTTLEDLCDPDSPRVIDAADYRAYNGRNPISGDDRRNPKIVMLNGCRFWLGRQRYRVTGTFGYLDESGNTPGDVWLALLKMTIERLLTPVLNSSQSIMNAQLIPNQLGSLVEEVTDDHKRKWSKATSLQKSSAFSALSSDPYVQSVITKYRNPIKIGTQTNWSRLEFPERDDQILDFVFGQS